MPAARRRPAAPPGSAPSAGSTTNSRCVRAAGQAERAAGEEQAAQPGHPAVLRRVAQANGDRSRSPPIGSPGATPSCRPPRRRPAATAARPRDRGRADARRAIEPPDRRVRIATWRPPPARPPRPSIARRAPGRSRPARRAAPARGRGRCRSSVGRDRQPAQADRTAAGRRRARPRARGPQHGRGQAERDRGDGRSRVDDVVEHRARGGARSSAASGGGRAAPARVGAATDGDRSGCWRGRCRRGPGPCARPAPRRGRPGRSRSSRRPGWPRCRRRRGRRRRQRPRRGSGRDQQARQEAGVQAAGPEHDELGVGDRGQRVLARPDVVGRDPDPLDPGRLHDLRLAVDDPAVAHPGVEGERRRPRPAATWPRTARMRFIWRTPSSKSPPSTAVIAAISRLPTRGRRAARSRRAPVRGGRGSGTGGARSSAARRRRGRRCSCGCRRPAGCRAPRAATPDDPPSSATVTIAVRLLVCSLSPRSSVDSPVPPPIATIRGPRARKLLVDQLDQRLVRRRPRGTGRSGRGSRDTRRTRPARPRRDPDDEPAQRERQELERDEVDERPGDPPGSRSRGDLAEEVGERQRQQRAGRRTTTQQPALDADPGRQPAPEVHGRSSSRWKTATGPKSLLAQPGGQLLGDDDRAVVAAGAADRDRQPGLALADVGRDREVEELVQERQEALGDRLAEDERADRLGQARTAGRSSAT